MSADIYCAFILIEWVAAIVACRRAAHYRRLYLDLRASHDPHVYRALEQHFGGRP